MQIVAYWVWYRLRLIVIIHTSQIPPTLIPSQFDQTLMAIHQCPVGQCGVDVYNSRAAYLAVAIVYVYSMWEIYGRLSYYRV